jgi:Fuc2NAc and GlcNAc transferase
MAIALVLQGLFAVASVFLLTWLAVSIAERDQWWESPSPRGSHERPTLSRGGVAFVVFLSPALPFYLSGVVDSVDLLIVLSCGLAIAIVGFIDDARPLPVLPRLVVHFVAASLSVFFLWAYVPGSEWWPHYVSPALIAVVLVLLWVWFINFFNFMDGIDGIASAEVAFIGIAGAWLSMQGGHPELASAWVLLAGAMLGFLIWNAPPARIFMGDVGSGFLGFVVGALLLLSVIAGALSLWMAVLLVMAFMGDATVTLLRRMLRGERWYEGHRQHAYQHLAVRWGSHGKVTLAYAGFNLVFIAPAVWLVSHFPDWSLAIVGTIASIVVTLCVLAGAGSPASPTREEGRPV